MNRALSSLPVASLPGPGGAGSSVLPAALRRLTKGGGKGKGLLNYGSEVGGRVHFLPSLHQEGEGLWGQVAAIPHQEIQGHRFLPTPLNSGPSYPQTPKSHFCDIRNYFLPFMEAVWGISSPLMPV